MSGRLPVTFYREGAKLPDFTDYSMVHRTRFSDPGAVLYPFGYGLQMNKYSVSVPEVKSIDEVSATLSVTVENLDEKEISLPVALYTDKGDASLPERCFALCHVERVLLKAGELHVLNVTVDSRWYRKVTDEGKLTMPESDIRFITR